MCVLHTYVHTNKHTHRALPFLARFPCIRFLTWKSIPRIVIDTFDTRFEMWQNLVNNRITSHSHKRKLPKLFYFQTFLTGKFKPLSFTINQLFSARQSIRTARQIALSSFETRFENRQNEASYSNYSSFLPGTPFPMVM